MNADLKSLNIPLNDWYDLTPGLYQQYTRGISQATNSNPGVQCVVGVLIVCVAALSIVKEI